MPHTVCVQFPNTLPMAATVVGVKRAPFIIKPVKHGARGWRASSTATVCSPSLGHMNTPKLLPFIPVVKLGTAASSVAA